MKRGRIRGFNFFPTSDKIIRREVGRIVGGMGIHISEINCIENEMTGFPVFRSYAANEKGESALWKETSCPNYEIEYDIIDLLS